MFFTIECHLLSKEENKKAELKQNKVSLTTNIRAFQFAKDNREIHYFSSFAEDSLLFQCQYGRVVSASSNLSISPETEGATIGQGNLSYNMEIDVGSLGGNSIVTISPNHSLTGIGVK